MPYGIPDDLWRKMSPDDQNEIIREQYAVTGLADKVPEIGGYVTPTDSQVKTALEGSGLPAEDQARILEAYKGNKKKGTKPGPGDSGSGSGTKNPKWVYAVNMPSTYPDFAAMKAAGTGMVVDMDDPHAADLIANAKAWGIPVGIQVGAGNPGDLTPDQYAAKVAQAKSMGADLIVLDVEAAGKGYGPTEDNPAGSPGWQFSQAVAGKVKGVVGDTATAVTMEPNQDDYNYKAYTDIGSDVWVQGYNGDMSSAGTPQSVKDRVVANGVDPTKITVILGPNEDPGDSDYVSYGIPQNGASVAGVYGSNPPPPGTYPGSPGNPGGSGPGGPGTVPVPPEVPPGQGGTTGPPGPLNDGTHGKATDWAQAYFGSLGLPPDVQEVVIGFFQKYPDDPNLAVELARQYIHTTPWFQQNFPGYFEGVRTGLFSDESGYRAYVNQANVYTMQYFNRPITTSEVESALHQGLSPEILGKTYEAGAIARAQGGDMLYELGAFGDVPVTNDNRGQIVSDLSREQAGIGSVAGAKIMAALTRADKRMQSLFQGQLALPATAGQALAPPSKPDLPA